MESDRAFDRDNREIRKPKRPNYDIDPPFGIEHFYLRLLIILIGGLTYWYGTLGTIPIRLYLRRLFSPYFPVTVEEIVGTGGDWE